MVVGVLSLGTDYLLLLLFYRGLHIDLPVATTVAFLLGLMVNFILNKLWSFRAAGGAHNSARQAVLYAILVVFNLLCTNGLVLYAHMLGIEPEFSKPVATALLTAVNFIAYKKIIFTS